MIRRLGGSGGGGDGRLEHLLIRDRDSGRTESHPAAGLFILIGAQPFTGWLPGAIARDQWGFILTGPDTAPHWPLPRAPFPFETTTPGVFGTCGRAVIHSRCIAGSDGPVKVEHRCQLGKPFN